MLECDVLVIGAGPAGSTAAAAAAASGAVVTMVEKKREVGVPVQCAEYIPLQVAAGFELGAGVVAQTVESMRTYLPSGEVVETPARGVICHRNLFDKHLVNLALEAGATLITGAIARDYAAGTVTAHRGEDRLEIHADVIIGADGPASLAREWMNLGKNAFVLGKQHLLPLRERLSSTEIFFRAGIPGGYGWVFPKGDTANVGVGVDPRFGISTREALKAFEDELLETGVIGGTCALAASGGLIPVGGQSTVTSGKIILAGDAAGQCNPVTGAGVPNAVFAGQLAGETAARAAAAHNMDVLGEYEQTCRLFLGDTLKRAVEKRRFLEPYWKDDARHLSDALRKGWIAFDEYYED